MKRLVKRPEAGGDKFRFSLEIISETQVGGHVLDPADLEQRLVVDLLIDGYPAAIARADLYDPELARAGLGDGCHGFVFSIEPAALQTARSVEIRIANHNEVLGPPVLLPAVGSRDAEAHRFGSVRWLGGLRFSGWLKEDDGERRVRASVDGQSAAEAGASHWTHIGEGRDALPVRGFDLHLPPAYADGGVHYAQILDEIGRELPGSPCAFVAFDDGLARFLEGRAEIESERLRGELFDRLIPQSLPFSAFAQWRARFPITPPEPVDAWPKVGVALIGGFDVEASVASLEAQLDCDWVAAALEGGDGEMAFPNASLREFLDTDAADCETIIFSRSGVSLQPSALALLAQALTLFPNAPAAYCDFTYAAEDGGEWPIALSAFDYERMLEQGYAAQIFAVRASYARAAVGAGVDNLFRLFNFSQDGARARKPLRAATPAAGAPVHVPGFLARLPALDHAASRVLARANEQHLSARSVVAKVEPGFGGIFPVTRIRRAPPRGKVSLLVPTRDRVDLLRPCIDSLFASVDLARQELIVLDNDSSDPETLAYFEEIAEKGVRVVRIGGPFNFAKIVNKGASIATGESLLLLNNDVEALGTGWLEEMQGRMAEGDVGAVGATLLWPSGVVQHAGVVLGPSFDASHAFNERIDGDPGYGDLLRAAHEVSAVTAACMLTDRRLFLELGGFDGLHFPVNYNDVDYCLKLRARGLRVVLTPHAKLLHLGSGSRGRHRRPDEKDRLQGEMRNLRAAWGDVLLADPYYNPLLSLDDIPFSGLAWPPRPAQPRQPGSPQQRVLPPGF
jgi:O-antigen biosynthesis protein